MGYYINPLELTSMFAVPSSIVDKHLKLATAEQLKVLLWALKNTDKGFIVDNISNALGLDTCIVNEALEYWLERGVLCQTDSPIIQNQAKPKPIKTCVVKPAREEVAKRGLENKDIAFILHETEKLFGRLLRQNEASTLVWLHDDQGLSASLLLMIVTYAVSEGRANVGFIERTAMQWVQDGITDVESAEKRLVDMRKRNTAWHTVTTIIGIEQRSPTATELETVDKWINDWGYGRDIIRRAYELCVDTTSKYSMPYMKKIISEWHKNGVNSIEDIEKLSIKPKLQKKETDGDTYMDFVNNLIKKNEEV